MPTGPDKDGRAQGAAENPFDNPDFDRTMGTAVVRGGEDGFVPIKKTIFKKQFNIK